MTRGEKCAPERYVYLSRIGTIAFYHSVIGHLYINVPNDLIETPDRDRFFTHVLKSSWCVATSIARINFLVH